MRITLTSQTTNKISKLSTLQPAWHRFFIGITGLASQTTIDAFNPWVDKETRQYSSVKTFAKMIITMTSGITVRYLGQKIGTRLVNKGLLKIPEGITKAHFADGVGKVCAIIGALLSIPLFDMPFTNKLLNAIVGKYYPNMVAKPPAKKEDKA